MKIKDITCLSDLYYVIGRWFTLIMVAISLLALPVVLDVLDSAVSFFMCAGIAFVGVAADYRDRTVYPVHYFAAIISGICSIVWVSCTHSWCLLLPIPVVLVALVNPRRWLLYCEIACIEAVLAAIVSDYWCLL